jgi:hypothetical protein
MSQPLAERLSRFTPDGSSLDRDSLLFAAGRASARPSRGWMTLASMLAASQLLTLVCLWPRTPLPPAPVPGQSFALPEPSATPPLPRDPAELGALRERVLTSEGDWAPTADEGPLVPPEPPLRAFGAPPAKYLN